MLHKHYQCACCGNNFLYRQEYSRVSSLICDCSWISKAAHGLWCSASRNTDREGNIWGTVRGMFEEASCADECEDKCLWNVQGISGSLCRIASLYGSSDDLCHPVTHRQLLTELKAVLLRCIDNIAVQLLKFIVCPTCNFLSELFFSWALTAEEGFLDSWLAKVS